MDLGTIKKRLEDNHYRSAQECIQDFNTMFTNCYMYNTSGNEKTDIEAMCEILEMAFREIVKNMPEVSSQLTIFRGVKGAPGLTQYHENFLEFQRVVKGSWKSHIMK